MQLGELKDDRITAQQQHQISVNLQKNDAFKQIMFHTSHLQCTHNRSAVKCTVIFLNYEWAEKSKILRHLLSFDERIPNVMFAIQSWFNRRELISQDCINIGMVTWLILFYFSKFDILPSYETFRNGTKSYVVNGANMAFNYNYQSKSSDRQTVAGLLRNFFRFYSKLSFVDHTICPAINRQETRASCIESESFCIAARELIISSKICIQDPFDSTRLLSGNVTSQVYTKFHDFLKETASKLESAEVNTVISILFNHTPTAISKTLKIQPERGHDGSVKKTPPPQLNKKTINIVYDKELFYGDHFKMFMSDILGESNQNNEKIQNIWAQLCIHMVIEILEKICCTQRDSVHLVFLPSNGLLSKKLLMEGLYIPNLNEINMQSLALNPSGKKQISSIAAVSVLCHIHSDVHCNNISIDFVYKNKHDTLERFLVVFDNSINYMIHRYFAKILHYYLLTPRTELNITGDQVPKDTEAYIIKDRGAILVGKKELRFASTEAAFRNLKSYLAKFDKSILGECNNRQIAKMWCKMSVDFIIDICTKIFAFKLNDNIDPLTNNDLHISPFFHVYNVTGIYDIFYRRKQIQTGFNQGGELLRQIKKTVSLLKAGLIQHIVPIRAIINVWFDTIDYNFAVIDIYNLNGIHQNAAFLDFFESIKKMIPKLIDNYFDQLAKGYMITDKNITMVE